MPSLFIARPSNIPLRPDHHPDVLFMFLCIVLLRSYLTVCSYTLKSYQNVLTQSCQVRFPRSHVSQKRGMSHLGTYTCQSGAQQCRSPCTFLYLFDPSTLRRIQGLSESPARICSTSYRRRAKASAGPLRMRMRPTMLVPVTRVEEELRKVRL
jgi:hypothetical protein